LLGILSRHIAQHARHGTEMFEEAKVFVGNAPKIPATLDQGLQGPSRQRPKRVRPQDDNLVMGARALQDVQQRLLAGGRVGHHTRRD
jgi:hypothetical protein